MIPQESYRKLRTHQHSPFATRRHDVSNYISPLSFGRSFMKIRSAVPENGCLIFLTDEKKNKKQKKNKNKTKKTKKCKKIICKTYTHPPPTGRRLRKLLLINWGLNQISPTVARCRILSLICVKSFITIGSTTTEP